MLNLTEMEEIAEWMKCQEYANLEFIAMINKLKEVIDQQADQIAYLQSVVAAMEGYDEDLNQLTIKYYKMRTQLDQLDERVNEDYYYLRELIEDK